MATLREQYDESRAAKVQARQKLQSAIRVKSKEGNTKVFAVVQDSNGNIKYGENFPNYLKTQLEDHLVRQGLIQERQEL